jgi:DNA-directed RNA polymerase specialized sigma24 family protein
LRSEVTVSAQRRTDNEVTRETDEQRVTVAIEETSRPIPSALDRLPPHLREAALRSWLAREEDYRYLADH